MRESEAMNVCGRQFTEQDLETVRREIRLSDPPLRAEIARRVCKKLQWHDKRGRLKAMSCRVALLRLHRNGHIVLPPPRNSNGNRQGLKQQKVSLPIGEPVNGSVEQLEGLELRVVDNRVDSALWNTLIDRYHYLGYKRLPGAQLRYFIYSQARLLGAMGWSAAAWSVAPRDRWIGWSHTIRQVGLNKVINHARFLILPWVRCRNLASKVLALSERCVVEDFDQHYGIRPVLLETFVEHGRYRGSCYRAANWKHVGQTRGRGKCDRQHEAKLPIKDVYVKPLSRDFRGQLGVGE